jgi:hypothetical protein
MARIVIESPAGSTSGATSGATSAGGPDEIADRIALRRVADDYARHADRREAEQLAALFEQDGVLRIVRRGAEGEPVVRSGRGEIAVAIAKLSRYEMTFHFVGNQTVDIDGDDAVGETYCLAHHIVAPAADAGSGAGRTDHVMFIRYQDRYRRHGPTWLIVERELQVDWTEDRPA